MKCLQPLLLGLGLFTILPVGRWIRLPVAPADQGRSVAQYPLVGLVIGLLLLLVSGLLSHVPQPLGAILLLCVWVGLTGALHLDGLVDCADAWYAGHADHERTLAVMKDPCAGPVGVTALALLLLLKLGALLVLGGGPALLAAPILGRSAATLLMATTPYQRRQGMATTLSEHLPIFAAWTGAAVAALFCAILLPLGVWFRVLVVAGLFLIVWRSLWARRVGGYTGDIAGALIECVETLVLVVVAL